MPLTCALNNIGNLPTLMKGGGPHLARDCPEHDRGRGLYPSVHVTRVNLSKATCCEDGVRRQKSLMAQWHSATEDSYWQVRGAVAKGKEAGGTPCSAVVDVMSSHTRGSGPAVLQI